MVSSYSKPHWLAVMATRKRAAAKTTVISSSFRALIFMSQMANIEMTTAARRAVRFWTRNMMPNRKKNQNKFLELNLYIIRSSAMTIPSTT